MFLSYVSDATGDNSPHITMGFSNECFEGYAGYVLQD